MQGEVKREGMRKDSSPCGGSRTILRKIPNLLKISTLRMLDGRRGLIGLVTPIGRQLTFQKARTGGNGGLDLPSASQEVFRHHQRAWQERRGRRGMEKLVRDRGTDGLVWEARMRIDERVDMRGHCSQDEN